MPRAHLFLCLCFGLLACRGAGGAQSPAPKRSIEEPVVLAPTAWPIFHANTHATASSPDRGPGAVSSVQIVGALTDRRVRRPSVSPWTVMAEPYADGSQAVITTPTNGVAKYLISGERFEAINFLPLDRNDRDFDWGILLLRGGLGVVTERKHNRFVLFGDARVGPRSPLEVKARIAIDRTQYGNLTAHFTLAPDGRLIALTDASRLIAVDLARGTVVASFDLPESAGTAFHNSFPIDDRGRMFFATQTSMVAVDWNARGFALAWTAIYDMRGPGCETQQENRRRFREALAVARGSTCTGSGTTPTILGDHASGVVVIVDGHAPKNNLVAFWRDTPPSGWQPLADPTRRTRQLDARVAGVFALPHSTPEGDGFTAENSPAALGNGIVIAQWAGFSPKPNAPRGVQRVNWNPSRRALELAWANPNVHFNGVPTIACTSPGVCHTYGMGRSGNGFAYTSLDFSTGEITGRVQLASETDVLDQGNNHAVAADGSIVYSGRYAMVRVR